MNPPFEVQGHRGARGLKPENTLAGFEVAFDLGVSAVETDLHLTQDDVIVVLHDAHVSARLHAARPGHSVPDPVTAPLVRGLSLAQVRGYRAQRNPDPGRFPDQDFAIPPLSRLFAARYGLDPLGIPTLAELFSFTAEYAGEPGRHAGKSALQRQRAGQVRFDLELKRVPFFPESIGDGFDGTAAGTLEHAVVAAVREAGVLNRTSIRSFDHRCVRAVRGLEPGLQGAVLIAHTAPLEPALVADAAGAEVYCPEYHFVDEALVHALKGGGKRVIPWTVNQAEEWDKLIAWGVDGITTDFPDRLLSWLAGRGIALH